MTSVEITEGAEEIRKSISDFDYGELLTSIKDDSQLVNLYRAVTSNYEKLHIYCVIFDDKKA